MPRQTLRVQLTEPERQDLERWHRAGKTEKRMRFRAQIVELAAAGLGSRQIAARLHLSRPTVVKWRRRFGQQRLAGLRDAPRSGPPRRYTATTKRRILAQLDAPTPPGRGRWNGRLLAEALGDVSADQVWSVLRKHGIQLQRRRSWWVSTDVEFAR